MKITFSCILFLGLLSSAIAQDFNYKVLGFANANSKDKIRTYKAFELIKKVANMPEFKQRVLNMKYEVGGYVYNGYGQTNMTPEKILQTIINGNENYVGGTEGIMDMFLTMYYEASDVVGYTSPSDKYVHLNRYFHQDYTPVQAARNLFHEWLHKLNHGHSQEYNVWRPHSVPYKLGSLVSEMAAEIESNGDPVLKEIHLRNLEADVEQCFTH